MIIEVNHHKDSEKYIQETFSRYIEVNEFPSGTIGKCVIHIYPYEDTTMDNGELSGYIDAMNCELHIYDTKNNTVYKSLYHDQVDIGIPCRVRIFKDLSTLLIFDRPVQLLQGKSLMVIDNNRH